jgi:acetyl esterase
VTSALPDTGLAARFPDLDATYAGLLDAARAAGLPPIMALSPAAARERVRGGDPLCAPGPDMLDVADVLVDAGFGGQIPVRRYVPHQLRTDTVLVWFHGGGWMTGDFGYSDSFCRLLADSLCCEVCSVEYRLAPEHPFPAGLDDALTAVRWAARDGHKVIVGGDSAGGNLAAVCAQQFSADSTVDVVGQLLVYPVVDCDVTRPSYLRNAGLVLGPVEMSWFFDQYVPDEADRTSPRFAPLRASSLRALPQAVVAVAGHDPLYDEGVAYADALRAAGVPVTLLDFPSLVHGFLRFTGPVAAASDATVEIASTARRLVAE